MSLETLLEAAEFLESRGQGTDGDRKLRQSIERQFSEPGTSIDGSDNGFHFVKGRPRTKSGAGTREVHNKLEKNRRAHLKECFDFLKKNIPSLEDRRTSNLGILRSSLRYIQNLKRKEREFELEMQRFAHEKIVLQERMNTLKGELNKMNIDVDINAFVYLPENDNDSNSTSTATERGTPPPSDHDEQDDDEEEAENLAMESNSPTPKSPRKRKLSYKKEIPSNMIHTESFPKIALHSSANGMITKSSSAPTFSVPRPSPKKVIPITLSLSGPVPSPSLSVINTINPGPAAFEMSVTGKILEIPPVRTPVTQILHRTLQQRQQALLTQKMATNSSTVSKVASAPLTVAQLKSPPLSQPLPVVTMATTQLTAQPSMVVKDGIVSSTKLITSAVGTGASKVVSATSGVPTMSIPYYMASLQKIAHPVLVTSLMAPAVGLQSTSATVPSTSLIPTISSGTPALPVKTVSKPETITSLTLGNNNIRTLNNLPTIALVSTAKSETLPATTVATSLQSASIPIRPIFAPNILPGQQLAWPFVTIPRSNVLVSSTPVPSQAATVVATSTSQVTSHPLVSLAQLNQLTQMMTPMTVMSPGIQMAPSALTQAQLNSMFTSPLLKQFPLGIPSSLLQSGQVLGQQVLKPVVVVTVPNVMSQSSATLPSNTALVTSSL
ncbi:max-binding protein MNT-like isoform X2 [Mercenaria mercenaria]|uniref:max-binding protein MNT-like isoform X2 n=1 Tax=Mercenaria mercenaria TaxID=6596 RepID=UPI00234EC9E8|nr:max-binding protein MNT-like isoform X2 [Mercenaria mercenaria]